MYLEWVVLIEAGQSRRKGRSRAPSGLLHLSHDELSLELHASRWLQGELDDH